MTASAMPADPLTTVEENALTLSQAAIRLDQARQQAGGQEQALLDALNDNAEVWIAIQSIARHANGALPPAVKANLIKLGDFVVAATLRAEKGVPQHTIDTLININLQISEGLLEGQARPTEA